MYLKPTSTVAPAILILASRMIPWPSFKNQYAALVFLEIYALMF